MKVKKQSIIEEEPKPGFVPPFIASLLSIIVPGLGQILSRAYRRGFVLLASFLSVIGLLIWRISLAGRRGEGYREIIQKAYSLRPVLVVITILIGIFYLWIIVDAYQVSKHPRSNQLGLLFLVLIIFFIIGWQIGDIDPVALVSDLDEAMDPLSRVIWPWENAVTYPENDVIAVADIQVPCTDSSPPGYPPETPGTPYIYVEPTCGNLSEQDGTRGTELTIHGKYYDPGKETSIIWENPTGHEFRQRQEGEYVKVIPNDDGTFEVKIIMPYRLLPPSAIEESYIWELKARQITSLGAPVASKELKLAVEKIVETIFIGMMATFFGVIIALPVSFLAARNLMSTNIITLILYYLVRSILNIIRSIEPLIWAVIALIVVGLGPFAGILALTIHSIAALAKLYSEAIESIDPGPIEAIQATGANWVQTVMFGVVPQIIPPFVSFTIYRWDINIRMSTIIGMVGGGGIGFILMQWIRLLDYRSAGIAIWFITVTVAILDNVSAEIRKRFT